MKNPSDRINSSFAWHKIQKLWTAVAVLLCGVITAQEQQEVGVRLGNGLAVYYMKPVSNYMAVEVLAGTDVYSVPKNEPVLFSDVQVTRKVRQHFIGKASVVYSFRPGFEKGFVNAGFYFAPATITIENQTLTDRMTTFYIGPMLGGGYRWRLSPHFTLMLTASLGYDINGNDFVPVIADGWLAVGYRF